ncbi:glycosyltransferase family 2 protein [Candidatus Odyssella thessalonicensis]|uniref:glycosyltransferase family 2 protein n=1 Tax=Candidatus Odyssella thessalonicensis TaxID=84647 RepID=UPI000225BFA1|nr:glycosyltransferase family 2 protein [Candidatus Odyssella thessalonicensis]
MAYKICAIIPTFNHYSALPGILQRLSRLGLETFIINDGSRPDIQEALQILAQQMPNIHLIHLEDNQGKGKAVYAGFKAAAQAGYTHAFQIDADGQHSLKDLPQFLELSQRNPHALISGQPIYDQSIPLARKIGRWFTHIWVWIETLSLRISDSMCGFRIYPVSASLAVMNAYHIGMRMDFDTEIMVRLFWQGTPVIMSPVAVSYPQGNLSNFDVFRDNWRITKMHTRLFFAMLRNLHHIIFKRPNYKNLYLPTNAVYWSSLAERGSLLGLFFFAWCYRLLGKKVSRLIGAPVVFYFYLTSQTQRHASKLFFERLAAYNKQPSKASFWNGFKHFMAFFDMALDKFAAWASPSRVDAIDPDSQDRLSQIMASGQGGMLLVSHLGNMEFCRATSVPEHRNRLHVLLHQKNSQRFHQLLKAFNPLSTINIIEVTQMGPETIIYLKEQIAKGDWVIIAGDRIPVNNSQRLSYASFLGHRAPFSQGPYILAALLECPVYTAIAVRQDHHYRVHLDLFAEKVTLNRHTRADDLTGYVQRYAHYLEGQCKNYPYQWFNFFDFWKQDPQICNIEGGNHE